MHINMHINMYINMNIVDTCIYRDRQNIYWDTKGEAESRKDTHQDQKEKGERKG